MALSTSIPAPRANPPKVIIFSVSPLKNIKLKVATIEIGIERLTINVVPIRRRNTNNTMTARTIPNIALLFTSPIALFIKVP